MVIGITKVRNEEHIIHDTLNSWSEVCDEIFVYDDASTDGTVEICHEHSIVSEVISSDLLDIDRLRAEWYNRQVVLDAARRFNPDWIAYFDGDEHLYAFDPSILKDPEVHAIATQWHDMYITPEDMHLEDRDYKQRKWCGTEYRQIPFFYRNDPRLSFTMPDQRIMHHRKVEWYPVSGIIQHWGKGHSEMVWERKVKYYGNVFGKYAEKWQARKGLVVHDYISDDGHPLVLFDTIVSGHEIRKAVPA